MSPSNYNATIHVLLINARSVVNKIIQMRVLVYKYNPDIVLITESWCTVNITDSSLYVTGYDLFRKDRYTSMGGGCLAYVKNP